MNKPTSNNTENDLTNVTQAILEAAHECHWYKPIKHTTYLQTWNEKLKELINENKWVYKIYLQTEQIHHYTDNNKSRTEVRNYSGQFGGQA